VAVLFPTNADTDQYNVQAGAVQTLAFDIPQGIFYYFDASDAGPTNLGTWINIDRAFDGGYETLAAGDNDGILKGTGTNAPSSGPTITHVRVRRTTTASSQFKDLDVPPGGWTWAKLQALHVEFDSSGSPDSVKIYDSDGGTLLGDANSGGPITSIARCDIEVNYEEPYLILLATGDDNVETWTTPVGFSKYYEVNDQQGDDCSIVCFYARAESAALPRVDLRRSASEEQVGVLMVVRNIDLVNPLAATHKFVSRENTNAPDPISTDVAQAKGATVIALTGNRTDAQHLGETASAWDTSPPSGYTIESAATAVQDSNTAGAPGRLQMGTGAGDAQQTWAYKQVTAGDVEDPGPFAGFTGTRDHKVVTFGFNGFALIDQAAFRFRDDDGGSETTAGWTADVNIDISLDAATVDKQFRLRFLLVNDSSIIEVKSSSDWVLEYSLNGGLYTPIGDSDDTSKAVRLGVAAGIVDLENTTQQIGSGSFTAGKVRDDNNTNAGLSNIGLDVSEETEFEYSLVLESDFLATNDVIDFRWRRGISDLGRLPAYTATPRVTVELVSGDATETVTDPVGVTDDVSRVAPAERTATDDADVTDATPHALTIIRSIIDPVGATDDTPSNITKAEIVIDPVGVTDDTLRVVDFVRLVTEAVAVTDDTTRVVPFVRTATDPVGVTDLAIDDFTPGLAVEVKIRPVSDVTVAGWDTAPTASQPLWEQLDEETPSDTDYIFAETP